MNKIGAIVLGISALLSMLAPSESCMCMPSHPQEAICKDHSFVALVKIRSEAYVRVVEKPLKLHKKEESAGLLSIITKSNEIESNEIEEEIEPSVVVPTASSKEVVISDLFKDVRDAATFIRYRVKIYKAYKGFTTTDVEDQKHYIYSLPDEGLCGRKFTIKGMYLITGSIVDGRLTIGLCDHVIPWNYLPKAQKRNVRNNMMKVTSACNAGCEVTSCLWSDCSDKKENQCIWNGSMEKKYGTEFHRANFICAPLKKGGCDWSGVKINKSSYKRSRRHNSEKSRYRHQQAIAKTPNSLKDFMP